MENENQLAFVRDKLDATPRGEWPQIAEGANVTLRTLYNVLNPNGTPGYITVFSLYETFKRRAAATATKRVRK